MIGWHHQLNGHEFGQPLGDSEGQRSLVQSMGFSRQEYWSGLPFPSPGDLPNPRIEPVSPALQTDRFTA